MYIVGSIYIKREPIIVLIELDSGHNMRFGFEDLISRIVRVKSFFNMLLLSSNSISLVAYIVNEIF